jgi:MoxR-like ATPase
MQPFEIAIELGKLSGPAIYAATSALLPGSQSNDKAANCKVLMHAIKNGTITLSQVQNHTYAVTHGTVMRPVATSTVIAPDPAMVQSVQASASAASRAESVALEAKALADALAPQVKSVRDGLTGLSESIIKTQAEVAAALSGKGQKAAVERTIAKAVAEAFAPIRAAAEANGTQAEVAAAAAAPVRQDTALAVFGVDIRDVKGNPVMVDVWDNPEAPQVDPYFVWGATNLAPLLAAQSIRANVWMGGEKGTGKTETARQFAARTGRAFTRVNFHKFTTSEEFIGATGLVNGNTVHEPGPVLRSHCGTPGAITLLDEITLCDPGELATLHALLEPNGRVNLGGKVWTAAPGALCFVADNSGGNGDASGRHAGVRVMNSALLDRFALKVPFTFLPLDQEVAAVCKHTGCSDALARCVMRVITTARNKVQKGDIVDAPSIRQVMAWIRSMPILGVRQAWDISVASAQPAESVLALEGIYAAEVNEVELLNLL